jgi:hypothetical protein
MNWWKRAYPEEPIDDPYQNQIFVDKFKKTFIENVKNIPKKLNIDKETRNYLKDISSLFNIVKKSNISLNLLFLGRLFEKKYEKVRKINEVDHS